jgi:hypothetical protein
MTVKLLDRVPRYLSLLGILGLIGIAGIFYPQLAGFSSLSFLSFFCYFRFLRWFAKPQPEVTISSLLVPFLGAIIAGASLLLFPGLLSDAPMFGLIGFAGYLGLYEPADGSQKKIMA